MFTTIVNPEATAFRSIRNAVACALAAHLLSGRAPCWQRAPPRPALACWAVWAPPRSLRMWPTWGRAWQR